MMTNQVNLMRLLAVCSMMAALALQGCGSGGTLASTTNPVANTQTTATQTLVTDAPADQVLSLTLTVNSIVLTDSTGATASVLSSPVTIEASHLDAVQEPLLPPLNIPQDTYVSATITVSNPVVTYVDSTGTVQKGVSATLAAASTTVTFNTPITVGAQSTPICFDLLVGQSVSISGTTVTVTPTFNVVQIQPVASPTNNGNGRVNDVFGKVVSVSGTTLIIQTPNGQQLTITTDNNTQLQGFTSLANLTAGELVDVDLAQLTSGTLLALRIHLAPANAADLLVGPVTSVTGSPATSFTQVVRQPLGPGVTPTTAGTTFTISVTGSTTFGLAPQANALPSLPFTASFTASNMVPGQNVAVTASSISGTTATAGSVTLTPQTVDGTVTAQTTSGGFTVYTVALVSGGALNKLSGASSVVVYVNSNTQLMTATAVAVGSTVRVNGLLFNDSGTLRLVAGQCNDMPPAPPPQHH